MITCIVYTPVLRELEKLEKIVREETSALAAGEWNLEFYGSEEQLKTLLQRRAAADIICLDITSAGAQKLLRTIRGFCRDSKILVIADPGISPAEYLRPPVHPDAVLLRPLREPETRMVFGELFRTYMDQICRLGPRNSYIIKTRDTKTILPYSQILYFESRSKKIYARTGKQEYGFYETMEHLRDILPVNFVRCHRSFIVNSAKVRRVLTAQNLLELENKEQIPISRTYKAAMKQL